MKLSKDQKNTIVTGILYAGLAFFLYNVTKGKSVKKSAKDTFKAPVEAVDAIVTEVKQAVEPVVKAAAKGKVSKEEFLRRMKTGREKRALTKSEADSKGGRATAAKGAHKGHKSTKGLAQDQELKSEEEHEKAYRKGTKKRDERLSNFKADGISTKEKNISPEE